MDKIEVIGVMSGTSLDGLDLCHVIFDLKNLSDFKIANSISIRYNSNILEKLHNIVERESEEINNIDIVYGTFIGESINKFISDFNLKNINLISSHGHTVFHQPEMGITLQIGNGEIINKMTGIKTVNNFRAQDLSLGGQGAPLVPIGDKILFSKFKYCLNLGGFINLSIKSDNQITAYDICPLNTVLNFYSKKMGYEFDENGILSSRGKINIDLFNELNSISFYFKKNPKSLGIEFVIDKIFPLIDSYKISEEETLATFVKHAAFQISKNINDSEKVLLSGGGTYNNNLVDILRNEYNINIIIPNKKIIDFKEALIFALLGVLRIQNKTNCLKSVTGAEKDHSSGDIYF
ncbi:MAG: anhydro-N-acetylmuramic acid kinase [Flavobacteriaceae bacterium]|nr:anhydro-N-acetylmuramic acid kinase [Flavobacteriaceae bacterium]MBL6684230.1 anhydro-N-acetylmuramic acid kinase [Flavobacteriaceae bacterium]